MGLLLLLLERWVRNCTLLICDHHSWRISINARGDTVIDHGLKVVFRVPVMVMIILRLLGGLLTLSFRAVGRSQVIEFLLVVLIDRWKYLLHGQSISMAFTLN